MAYNIKLEDGRTAHVGNIVGPVEVILSRRYTRAYIQKFEEAVREELSFVMELDHPITFRRAER